MTQKSYTKGCEFPVLKRDTLRLYSMRFCPFAQRTRLVLAHKEIPYETVNVHLKQKPDWFLDKNPLGLVPTLEFNDEIVYESAICDEYLDGKYPEKPLTPKDPYVKARQRIVMEHFAKFLTFYYKCVRNEENATETLQNLQTVFENELGEKKFFGGDQPDMLDYHLWPWYERPLPCDMLPKEKFPRMTSWMKAMWEIPAVKATAFDEETHKAYRETSRAGKPNYDMGL